MIARHEGQDKILRAGDGIRTHDNDVGNVVLYQLSYTRTANHDAAPAARGIPKL